MRKKDDKKGFRGVLYDVKVI